MILPLVNKLNFNVMTEYGINALLWTAPEIDNTDPHTKSCLKHLSTTTKNIPDNTSSITLENHIK